MGENGSGKSVTALSVMDLIDGRVTLRAPSVVETLRESYPDDVVSYPQTLIEAIETLARDCRNDESGAVSILEAVL